MEKFKIREGEPFIRLGQAIKAFGAVENGAQAKIIINDGFVDVNGSPETRRGKKLVPGDEVFVHGKDAGLYEDSHFTIEAP